MSAAITVGDTRGGASRRVVRREFADCRGGQPVGWMRCRLAERHAKNRCCAKHRAAGCWPPRARQERTIAGCGCEWDPRLPRPRWAAQGDVTHRGGAMTAEHRRLEENRQRNRRLACLGPVSERAPVGHRARGLQRRTATPGTTSRTTRRARAPIAGARTASPGSATSASACASRSRCGTGPIRSSRSACSGSPTARATTARTSRSTGSTSTARPTHSYMKMLYKYPQREFPYDDLVATNGRRGKDEFEYELIDTGIFDDRPLLRRLRRVRQGRARRHPR